MSTTVVQSRVKTEMKEQADAVFEKMGLTTAEAIRVFLKHCINNGELPFRPKAYNIYTPSESTLKAMQEPNLGKSLDMSSLEAFEKSLGV